VIERKMHPHLKKSALMTAKTACIQKKIHLKLKK